jgi:glycosyltransferase involved in cell wall biosynthesis
VSARLRAAFVMEQTLGHVTHYRNMREVVADRTDVHPIWLPIPFDVRGPEHLVPLLRSNWSVRASWRARSALMAALSQQQIDVMLFHTQVTALFSHSIMRRVPAVVSLDATPINYDSVAKYYRHRPAGTGLLDRRKRNMNRQTFELAAALVTWSKWARQSLIDDYGINGDAIRVITPGAAASFFALGQARSARPPRSPGDPIQLLFVGGDFQRKGGALLLESMRGGLGERCNLHVVTREVIRPQPGVFIHNGVAPNSAELHDLFAAADIFVLPTYADCLALVLMEAAAAGLPVVATSVGALAEAFTPGESGLLVPPDDVRALTSALTALVDDAGLRRRMGRAGHSLARHRFDARSNALALLDLMSDVARDWQATRRRAA